VTWGHLYLMLNMPAIPAPGECVPNVELFRRLAKTMGFTDDYWDRTDEEMLRDFYDWDAPALKGITYDLLKERGYMRLNVGTPDQRAPHAEGNFPTPSGKCEFKSSLAEKGNFVIPVWRSMYDGFQPNDPVDPVPDYIPPFESPASSPDLAQRYPLSIISPKPHAFLNTQYANETAKQHRQGQQKVFMHPGDAAARAIRSGDLVRVFNERGSFEAPAELTTDLIPGLVMANVGYWLNANRSETAVNSISSDTSAEMGNAGSYFDNLVEVALCEPEAQLSKMADEEHFVAAQ
jgi:anaerobic selenocysteine-containing dehydrogenase